ncbi:MAG: CHAT domain-containing protein, partial [Bacteroidota bacterium]
IDFLLNKTDFYASYDDLDNEILTYERILNYQRTAQFQQCQESLLINAIEVRNILSDIFSRRLGRYEAADSLSQEARDLIRQLPNSANQHRAAVTITNYINQALSLTEQQQFDEAIVYNNKALMHPAITPQSTVRVYNNMAYLFILKKDFSAAETWLKKAEHLALANDIYQLDEFLYDNLSDVARSKGNYTAALRLNTNAINELVVHSAVQIAAIDFTDRHNTLIYNPEFLVQLMASRAEIHTLTGRPLDALKNYQQIADLVERIRLGFRPDASKGLLAKSAKPIFAAAIANCWALYQKEKNLTYAQQALLFAAQSSSLILYDAVQNGQAAALLPDTLQAKDKALQMALAFAEQQLLFHKWTAYDSPQKEQQQEIVLQENVSELRQQLNTFRNNLARSNKAYHTLITQSYPRKFDDLRAGFSPEQSYIKYFTHQHNTFAFVINGQKELVFLKLALTKDESYDTLTELIRAYLHKVTHQEEQWFEPAYRLYQSLLEPLLPYLSAKEITIIPDGAIAYISFDLLPTTLPKNSSVYLSFDRYLLFDKIISYQYSLVLDGKQTDDNIAEYPMTSFLGIAPTFEDITSVNGRSFAALNETQKLTQKLACAYGCDAEKWFGNAKEQFLVEAEDYRIIQLASHAVANTENGDLSYVLLGDDADQMLTAKEIYGLRLPRTALVSLTTCEGADGELADGEGVISLGRSFFYAGAKSIVSVLWAADEAATTYITEKFHNYLLQGIPKD